MMSNEEVYIQAMKDQISQGIYDHLFVGRTGLTFLDIGANIGLVSIYAVPYCSRIVAIEPDPETYRKLLYNTKPYPVIECYQVALAPENKVVEFFQNDINFTASSTVNTYGTRISVRGWTLEHIIDYHRLKHIDVCKVDCEGAEGESLSLLQIDLAKDIIDQWYIEFHNCPKTSWEHKLGTIVGNLARCGYKKMKIEDKEGMALTASRV